MAAVDLTAARVRELLDYDPEAGRFHWRQQMRGPARAGAVAGCARRDGYVKITIDQHRFFAHRLAWLWVHGQWPCGQIDHLNGDPTDNRICNLRDVSAAVNSQNERRARSRKNGGSLIGAHWSPHWKRWRSSIGVDGKQKHLGWFDTEDQAHAAYVDAKRRLHPGCTL